MTRVFATKEYDLGATLSSGQAFRWNLEQGGWTSVIGSRWVKVRQADSTIIAETAEPVCEWSWLTEYLQLDVELGPILDSFPEDEPMRRAVAACRGLRLLRQDPWECLASFILSSTKQIVQIRQVISAACGCFGEPVTVPDGFRPAQRFPTAARLAAASESDLRACKMGFRAPYLLETAQRIAGGHPDLTSLRKFRLEQARQQLLSLPGVGRKIADCVLLFAYGFADAFPVDVWVMKALRELYFPRRRIHLKSLQEFSTTHFGPHAGYAQQYLFHYMRTKGDAKRIQIAPENE